MISYEPLFRTMKEKGVTSYRAGEAGLPAVQLLCHEARRQRIDPHHQPALPPAAMPRGGRDGVYRRGISGKNPGRPGRSGFFVGKMHLQDDHGGGDGQAAVLHRDGLAGQGVFIAAVGQGDGHGTRDGPPGGTRPTARCCPS